MTTRTFYARIGLSLSLGLLVISAGMRQAHAEPRRLGVVTFRGPGEGATRNVVMKVAKANRYQVVGGQQIAKTASKLHVTLDTNDAFKSVAKELGIAAFITGEVTKKKATLTVRNGLDGSVSAEASWTGPNPRKLSQAVSKTLWRRLGSAIDRTKPPSGGKAAAVAEEEAAPETGADDPAADEPEEKPKTKTKVEEKKTVVAAAEEPAADEAASERRSRKSKKSKKQSDDDGPGSETTVSAGPDPDDDEDGPALEALVLGAGGRTVNRSLSYVQDLYRANSKYNLGASPNLGFHVDFFPAALGGGRGFAANVGLTADVAYMLPLVTSPAAPMPIGSGRGSYATYSLDWSLGAKVRLPMGLYGTVGYGAQRYQLIPTGGATGIDVPMVDYRYVRVGGGGRFHVTPQFALMANAAYLQCLSLGQIRSSAYFPKATCGALEVGAAAGYRINSFLEVQGGVDVRRYGLAFHVTVADAQAGRRVAGGAVDQYITLWAQLAVVLGGSGGDGGGKASHGDDEAKPDDEAKGDDEDASPPKKKAKKVSDDDAEGDAEAEEKPSKKKKKQVSDEDLGL